MHVKFEVRSFNSFGDISNGHARCNFLTCHDQTVPGKMLVKSEVCSFNRFKRV